ncbi:MAG: low specificity L-threonine aldolase [Alphaproteobacteria bacterium]
MNFESDNVTSVSPAIMDAIVAANAGSASSYGADAITKRLDELFSRLFETDVAVMPVVTGTAANALSLATFLPGYGAAYCHAHAHINAHEAGAPEFYSGGGRLVSIEGAHAKYDAAALGAALDEVPPDFVHMAKPAIVSLSQSTELGVVYSLDEVRAIASLARGRGLAVHMDGARFGNALVRLGCSPADLTWRAGVDVLSFGATKNGALAAEAVVLFDKSKRERLAYLHKRGGHLLSKMRFISAQLEAYLKDDLWLENARHANRMATRLAEGLGSIEAASLAHPVEANEVFASLPDAAITALAKDGFGFFRRGGAGLATIRLVTAHNTRAEDVEAFLAAAARHAGSVRRRA